MIVMITIDGEDCVLGRVASYAAQKALRGETVEIYNAEKLIVTGNPVAIMGRYRQRRELRDIANPLKSQKYPRRPELFVKRTIRGMLPRKSRRGDAALKRIRVYVEPPRGKAEKVYAAKPGRRMTVGEICVALGWSG